MQITVKGNKVEVAMRIMKKKMQQEGTFRIFRAQKSYEKPCEKRLAQRAEALMRYRKLLRKRKELEEAI